MCLTWVNLTPSLPGAVRPCLNTSLLFSQAWLLGIYCKSFKEFSQKICFDIFSVQKNARHVYLLFTAFWHQHSKFQRAQREPELPFTWQGGSGVKHGSLHGSQCNASQALQGRLVQGVFCLKTPPTKAISLMRTCALEAVGLRKNTTFSSPCPNASPITCWFWDYVHQTACGYIQSYV